MLRKSSKAQQGIGVIISFIMVVIVVSIAASVITSTASSLSSTSNELGEGTKDKLTASLEVSQVIISKGPTDGQFTSGVSNVSVLVKLQAGSGVSKISDLLLQFGTPRTSQQIYASGNSSFDTSSFGFSYLVRGGKYQSGYINDGDLVQLDFTFSGSNIQEGDRLLLNIIQSDGGLTPVRFNAPSSILKQTNSVYP